MQDPDTLNACFPGASGEDSWLFHGLSETIV